MTRELPLSFPQERLWFLHQLNPGDTAYNEPFAWRLTGQLDVPAMRRAVETLVKRHEVLRTVFRIEHGHSLQAVLPEVPLSFEVRDLSTDPAGGNLDAVVRTEVARPFDLTRGPILRVLLLRSSDQEHVLLLVTHHIVIDSWSLGSLRKELGTLYSAFARGMPSPLPDPRVQYSEFARWQRETMTGPKLEEQLGYWRRELAGEIPILLLPGDRPRPSIPSSRGARRRFALSPQLTQALKTLARREGATLYITLLAGFQTLLHRYTGLEDFAVGTVIANRVKPEFETMLGFCANTLVMRANFSGEPTVLSVLRSVRDRALDAYDFQDVPLEQVVADLQPARHAGRNPFFDAVIVFESTPAEPFAFAGLAGQTEPVSAGTAKFDLTLFLEETQGGVAGTWEYRTDMFDPATIERMSGHFERLLAEMAADPAQLVSTIPLLTDHERHQLVVEWNDTRRSFPREKTIHQLFEEQTARAPDAVALIDDDTSLTYRQLNERANQLAHYLGARGVRERDRVAVVLDRSIDYVIAVLAILKSGAAYVPVDPESPPLRLKTVCDDARVKVVVEPSVMRESAGQPATNPNVHVGSADPCYVIYTSGSTGAPKGVEVRHRGVVRLVFGNNYLPFDEKQTFLLLAPVQFDVSTLELWGPLLHGSRLAVDSQRQFEIPRLASLIQRHKVTCLWLTSALFNVVIDHRPDALNGVPYVLVGGEALSVSHIRRALEHLPGTQLINGYGPTETTTFATTFAIPSSLPADATSVSIGRPIGNTEIYILGGANQVQPIGIPGEICIGGDGVAAGYVGDPALTAIKFIPNPFEPGTTLYRTGDLGRYLADGTIEFLGRTDHQVKVRGFRVELGEVEHHLSQHPDVGEAVVVVKETGRGDRALSGYVTGRSGARPTGSALQRFLSERLPSYCVPSTITVLDVFPISATGKVDRKAVSALAHLGAVQSEAAANRTPTEEWLTSIWQQVLGVSAIGTGDNFFDHGGDSLLATRVLARIESDLGARVRLSSFFRNPTIAELAKALDAQSDSR